MSTGTDRKLSRTESGVSSTLSSLHKNLPSLVNRKASENRQALFNSCMSPPRLTGVHPKLLYSPLTLCRTDFSAASILNKTSRFGMDTPSFSDCYFGSPTKRSDGCLVVRLTAWQDEKFLELVEITSIFFLPVAATWYGQEKYFTSNLNNRLYIFRFSA